MTRFRYSECQIQIFAVYVCRRRTLRLRIKVLESSTKEFRIINALMLRFLPSARCVVPQTTWKSTKY
jgi:hypothetical protein